MKITPATVCNTICRKSFWLRGKLLPLTFLWVLTTLSAYGVSGTFDYESVINGTTSFTYSNQTWTLTGDMGNVIQAGLGAPAVGAASPASNGYMDTGYGTTRGLGDVGGIKAPTGYTFRAAGFDVWPSTDMGNTVYGGTDNTLGTVGLQYTVIGKKNNLQVVSANVTDTARTPAQSGTCPGGYWHHIDLSTTAFATTDIDTVEFLLVTQTGTAMNYLAVDNFSYTNFGLLVTTFATTTTVGGSPNPSTYGQSVTFTATVARAGGSATPTGTVTFKEGTSTLGTGTLSGSGASANATFSTSTLSTGNHTITASYAGDANFTASSGSSPVQTVNQATPNVTVWPTASTITFGQTLANSSLTGGAATPPGNFAFTSPGTQPGAGTAPQSVTFTPSDSVDYKPVTNSVSVTVNQATPNVTAWPTAGTITYGQTLANSSLTGGTATTSGNFAFTSPATQPGAGTASQSVTFTPSDSVDYKTVSGSVTVTVNQATPNVTVWPTASSITYGQTLASSSLTGGAATPPGNFAFTSPGTQPGTGTASQSVTFTPSDSVDYKTVSGSVTVTVNQATPNVTAWPTAGAIYYGQTLASSTLTGGAATTSGGFAFTSPGTAPGVGTASQSVTFTPTDTADYSAVSGSVTVLVNPAPVTVTWPTASPIIVGQALSTSILTNGSATSPGGAIAGNFAFATPTLIPPAGQYPATVLFTPSSANYQSATNPVTVAVLDPQTPFTVGVDYVFTGYSTNSHGVTLTNYSVSDFNISWPDSQLGWQLQAQTNILGVGFATNWTVIPGSEFLNHITIPTTNPCAFFRLYNP